MNYNPYYNQPFMRQDPSQLIRVTGIDGARAYQMAPNSVAALFDSMDDLMYIKSTEADWERAINTPDNELEIVDGNFIEGEKVTVKINGKVVTRKVWYHSNAGDLAITYDNKNWLFCEFM